MYRTVRFRSHIASSLGDIAIPTRNPFSPNKQATLDTPDLSYLKEAPTTSLSRRLADGRALELPEAPPAADNEARRLRIEKLTAQRKAERVAREAATKYQAADLPQPTSRGTRDKLTTDLKSRIDALTAQRRADRAAYGESDARIQQSRREEQFEGTHVALAQLSRRAVSSGNRGPQRPDSRSRTPQGKHRNAVAAASLQTSRSSIADKGEVDDDEGERRFWDMILNDHEDDDWCPGVILPQFTDCDVPFTAFGDVFCPPATTVPNTTSAEKPDQWTRETSGGDYSRFRTTTELTIASTKLDPVQFAQLALSKRRDVHVGSRKEALAIIASSTNKSNTRMIRRV